MLYPKFIKDNDNIGLTAPSLGITKDYDVKRLNQAKINFKKYSINILETDNVRKSSIDPKDNISKVKEFESLLEYKNISGIFFASGGEFMMELLPLFDFTKLVNNPKWIQGYSDPTNYLYVATTKYDVATIYSNNFKVFGMKELHKSLEDNINILKGNLITQNNFEYYESNKISENPYDSFNLDTKVKWKILTKEKNINVSGRIIGGCIDILTDIFGTTYDNTLNFIEKYKEDGTIWYFDNCELSSEKLILTLWKFKENGYFKYTKAIIFGRSGLKTSNLDISYEDAILRELKDLNIPIICDADIGHVPPRITIINGAIANLEVTEKDAKIDFILK